MNENEEIENGLFVTDYDTLVESSWEILTRRKRCRPIIQLDALLMV